MDVFGIDDLLDFSNEQTFVSSISSSSSSSSTYPTTTATTATTSTTITTIDSHNNHHYFSYLDNPTTSNFTDPLCIPNDDIAELEWLSNFVDESSSEFPAYSVTGTMNVCSDTSFNTNKRSHSTTSTWTAENTKTLDPNSNVKDTTRVSFRGERSPPEMSPRKCTHCSSEKTPQWRTGPLGPKTLCNACGVRYKSGRLVPEYRPAASPTFVLTEHSNSHRKVMELRRQKELYRQQQQEQLQLQEMYGNPNRRYQVC